MTDQDRDTLVYLIDHPVVGMAPEGRIVAAIRAALAEIDRLRAAESNFLTYGQGGADYAASQWIDRLREQEERAERAEAEVERLRAANSQLAARNSRLQGLCSEFTGAVYHASSCKRPAEFWPNSRIVGLMIEEGASWLGVMRPRTGRDALIDALRSIADFQPDPESAVEPHAQAAAFARRAASEALGTIEGSELAAQSATADDLIGAMPVGGPEFVVVPRSPTRAMLEAAWADALDEDAAAVWSAMIGAAPPVTVPADPGPESVDPVAVSPSVSPEGRHDRP